MKYTILFFLSCLLLTSCWSLGDSDEPHVLPTSLYEAISVHREVLHQRIQLQAPQPAVNTGKIYIKDNYLFIIEQQKGVHVYDNTDRTNPVAVHFIPIPEVTDISIKDDLIYAHHYTDLVALRANFVTPTLQLVSVTPDAFPGLTSPDGSPARLFGVPDNHVVIAYQSL